MQDEISETIFSRKEEIRVLDRLYASKRPELLAVYGRRRTGKTFLIQNFFAPKGRFFKLTGVKGASSKTQLKNFAHEFSANFTNGTAIPTPGSWQEAFIILKDAIAKTKDRERIILFFDELPWLASPKSGFLLAFDYFWNQYMSHDPRVLIVICGSAAAWMIQKVIGNRGGLHGRVTCKIGLEPFTLGETERYLKFNGVTLDRRQVVEIYMAIGGIPAYLSLVEPGQSSAQVIQSICFSRNGYLVNEFHNIYASLFDDYEHHVKVVETLALNFRSLSRQDLMDKLKLKSGGSITKILRELEESGFVKTVSILGSGKKHVGYHLVDPFTLFYLKWMHGSKLATQDHWTSNHQSQKWVSWAGHAFETICMLHIAQIKESLGISGIHTTESKWLYRGDPSDPSDKGAQIDLIIDRADSCMNLCEVKFYRGQYTMTKDYADLLLNRKQIFYEKTRAKKALFTTLITPYGATKNPYFLSAVENQITLDDLFDAS